ncbi:hypothetical protein [Agromyces sp. NPDC058104]|uniref:hypothetical protein n=1 Tax=Agromyces sp. NPDC058104 TaxID=3346342 RepID=UPI0036DAE850
MQLDQIRPFPIRVRVHHRETTASYVHRLIDANAIQRRTWTSMVNSIAKNDSVATDLAEERLAERAGGLRQEHFALARAARPAHEDGTRCPKCDTLNSPRFACRLCAAGELITLHPHQDGNVCRRHRIWTGLGFLWEQHPVSETVIRADRKYRQLVRAGLLDSHRLAELTACIDAWQKAEQDNPGSASEQFTLAIQVAAALLPENGSDRLPMHRPSPPNDTAIWTGSLTRPWLVSRTSRSPTSSGCSCSRNCAPIATVGQPRHRTHSDSPPSFSPARQTPSTSTQ